MVYVEFTLISFHHPIMSFSLLTQNVGWILMPRGNSICDTNNAGWLPWRLDDSYYFEWAVCMGSQWVEMTHMQRTCPFVTLRILDCAFSQLMATYSGTPLWKVNAYMRSEGFLGEALVQSLTSVDMPPGGVDEDGWIYICDGQCIKFPDLYCWDCSAAQ